MKHPCARGAIQRANIENAELRPGAMGWATDSWHHEARRFARAMETWLVGKSIAVGVLLMLALAIVVYLPMVPGSFVMDDWRLVTEANPLVTGELSARTVWFQTDFPLTLCAWWGEWHLWGNNPAGYHVVNVALHGMSAILLWRILARLRIPGAWLAGAIFVVHPVCVGSVARIAELKNTLSLPFFLLSVWAYLRYESGWLVPSLKMGKFGSRARCQGAWWLGLSFVAFVLALLSKTTAVMLPFALFCCAVWQRGRITSRDVQHVAPYFVLALPMALMSVWFQKFQALAGEILPAQSFVERVGVAGRDFWFYFSKAILPNQLTVFYPRWRTEVSPLEASLPVLLALMVFILCWRARRGWGRHALFGLACFAILLFPALGFFDAQCFTKFQVSDHLQYLPIIAMVSLAGAAIACLPGKWAFGLSSVALLVVLSVLSFRRAEAFATEEGLMRDALLKNPVAWAAENDLGVALLRKGKVAEASELFIRSIQTNPDNTDARLNLGMVLTQQGRLSEARAQFRTAVKIRPNLPEAHEDLAMILERMGRDGEAIYQLNSALEFTPKIEPRLDLAGLFYQAREFRRAVTQYRRVLSAAPDNVQALNNLAWLLATCPDDTLRDGAEAIRLAQRGCRLTGFKKSFVISTLAAGYAEAGRFPEAVQTAEMALKMQTEAGEMQFASVNRQLLEFYRAGKRWHTN